jgi:hypothetical protein
MWMLTISKVLWNRAEVAIYAAAARRHDAVMLHTLCMTNAHVHGLMLKVKIPLLGHPCMIFSNVFFSARMMTGVAKSRMMQNHKNIVAKKKEHKSECGLNYISNAEASAHNTVDGT